MRDTVFSEALDATWAVAVSRTGQYWAAGSRQGNVRVWKEGGRRLHLVWPAHTNVVYAPAFSPDERTLATGSWDGTVKLWDLDNGALLWTGWHTKGINCVAFSPDGSMLASGSHDETVRLWNSQSGTNLQTLAHSAQVFEVAWSPDGGLLASGDFEGSVRLWEVQQTLSATCVQMIAGHTNWVLGLAFAPDGSTLASGSWDRHGQMWEVASGRLCQTLLGIRTG